MNILFGPQAAAQAGSVFLPDQGSDEITVLGQRPVPMEEADPLSYEDNPPRPSIVPRYVSTNQDVIPPTEEEMGERIERKGMFGVKGTLRDVLGTLGDAFLIQSGNSPMYAPRRREERIADAMFGYTDSFEAGMGAVERLAQEGFGAEAEELRSRLMHQQVAAQNANRQEEAAKVLAEKRRLDVVENQREELRNLLYRLPADIRQAAAEEYAKNTGTTLEKMGVPGGRITDNWIMAGISVKQGEDFERTDRRLDDADERIRQADERIGISRQTAAERARANRAREDYRDAQQRLREAEFEASDKGRNRPQKPLGNRNTYTTKSGRTFTRKER
jgi:hypothetical protein